MLIDDLRCIYYVMLKDLVRSFESLLGKCDCLGAPSDAITIPNSGNPGDPDLKPAGCYDGSLPDSQCEVSCTAEVERKAATCPSDAQGLCNNVETLCSSIGLMADTADLDVDRDGNKDALSFGAMFEMTGARISGVAK